jgi:hypothetical protein
MRKIALASISALLLLISNPNLLNAASIAGTKCTKAGTTKTASNIKYTCVKQGSKLVWNKGVVIKPAAKATPAPTPTPTPTPSPSETPKQETPVAPATGPKAGDLCKQQGEIAGGANNQLICRRIVDGKLKYFTFTNSFTTESNPKSPDSLTVCRLTDQRSLPISPEGTQIAYPITPHVFNTKAGIEKIAVVGFDFSDSPGQGSPLDIFGDNLTRANNFFNWYSNGKVKFEYATYDKWIRLRKPSASYETGEHFSTNAGSLTVQQMAHEFHAAISQYINLNGYTSIWFVYPKTITKITQNYGLASGNDGLPSFYGFGPNNYPVEIPLWTYYIHEMLHEQGLQGHSPKAPWRFGVLLNGDGYTAGMNSWDELAVDWMAEEDIYCIDKGNLKPVKINLAPIERQQGGVHSVMIKLDNHRALVIESHRSGDFAQGMPDYGYGLTLQVVDTTKSTGWNDDSATSIYIQFANNQRYGPAYGTPLDNKRANEGGFNIYNGVGVSGARWGLDQNYLLLEGESYTFEGIKVEFLKSGNTDLVSIG